MFLVFSLISEDYMTEESFDVMGKDPIMVNQHPSTFTGHVCSGSRDIMI